MGLYLIKRGPRPEHHVAPFHPVIMCNKKGVAKWQAGATDDRAWVWTNQVGECLSCGWLLERWNGLDIDYGHLVREVGPLPDGSGTAFYHDRDKEPWTLLKGAVWWDDRKMPEVLAKAGGLIYPPDDFTRETILHDIARDDPDGFRHRTVPDFWPPITLRVLPTP